MPRFGGIAALLLASFLAAGRFPCALAADEDAPLPAAKDEAQPRSGSWTMGGVQFWSDELVFHRWRIQKNTVTGHFRLLDENDRRHASGTFAECQAKLDEIKRQRMLPPMKGPAVVTLHGLFRSRDVMNELGEYLEQEGNLTWINVSYASTRRTLDDHAASLAHVIDHLQGVNQVDLVCHSLGNLVVRRYLGEVQADEPKWKPDPRLRRMVMLGPPNNGASMAAYFKDNKVFGMVLGPSGKQLAGDWRDVEKRLAVPPFEFGIIAGSKKVGKYENPLLAGDDDLVVTVEETKLKGACDFLTLPLAHSELTEDSEVHKCVLHFLQDGCFVAPDKKMPIGTGDAPAQGTP